MLVVLMVACGGGSDPAKGDTATSGATPAGTTAPGTTPAGTATGGAASTGDTGASVGCATDPAWTVGLVHHTDEADDGYTLFAPENSGTTWLIDACGREVHRWTLRWPPGKSVHLTDDGVLVRSEELPSPVFSAGGIGGVVRGVAWDGTEQWAVTWADGTTHQHHEALPMPGGTLLLLAWELRTGDEARAAGRDPALLDHDALWPDTIVEVTTAGEVVWRWRAWDHLVQDHDPTAANFGDPAAHPELIDLNVAPHGLADWTHANSLAYDAALDQILVSVHGLGEVWVIDHSTTTEEAAGHTGGRQGRGGDLLYRWGNPANYGGADPDDRWFFGQHHATWIPAGLPGAYDVLVFDNGQGRPGGSWSRVVQITTPVDAAGGYSITGRDAFAPDAPSWTWSDGELYTAAMGGAQRLANGSTLVTDALHGTLHEVTADGRIVWTYVNPVVDGEPLAQGEPVPEAGLGWQNPVFRAVRLPRDHPGLAGRDLTPGAYVER